MIDPTLGSGDRSPGAGQLIGRLQGAGLSLAVAESLTGGLLMAEFVAVPGASAVLSGGVVAYRTELKSSLLAVEAELLARTGAVHPLVARQMAAGVRRLCSVQGTAAAIGLATTGVAGPEPSEDKPVGTVCVGISSFRGERAEEHLLGGSRAQIRAGSVAVALAMLSDELTALARLAGE